LDEAVNYFTEALVIIRRRKQESKVAVRKILNLMGNIHLQEGSIVKMMDCYMEASRIFEAREEQGVALVIAGYNLYGLSWIYLCCVAIA
jgi:hypothetical protein